MRVIYRIFSLLGSEPVAVSLNVDDYAVMQHPVQNGGNDHMVAEQLGPVSKSLVKGDDGAGFLIRESESGTFFIANWFYFVSHDVCQDEPE